MEYLPRTPLRYEHFARHARTIPCMLVFSHAHSWFIVTVNTTCDFVRVWNKEPPWLVSSTEMFPTQLPVSKRNRSSLIDYQKTWTIYLLNGNSKDRDHSSTYLFNGYGVTGTTAWQKVFICWCHYLHCHSLVTWTNLSNGHTVKAEWCFNQKLATSVAEQWRPKYTAWTTMSAVGSY